VFRDECVFPADKLLVEITRDAIKADRGVFSGETRYRVYCRKVRSMGNGRSVWMPTDMTYYAKDRVYVYRS
jgi:hypothetical protein